MFSLMALGKNSSLPAPSSGGSQEPLVCLPLEDAPVQTLPEMLCMCLGPFSSSHKNTGRID